jgi:cysteine-S-conjugate beta-lyase
MTSVNFDKIVNRFGTDSLKYDMLIKVFGTTDLLPLWVADMDFASPDFILDAIRKRCDQSVLGYTITPESWYEAICSWLKRRHGWNINRKDIGFIPGIVSGIGLAIQCFTKPGDKILIQTPVYPPFMSMPKKNGCEIVINQLVYKEGKFSIDFNDFEKKAASGCKMFILCSPHNPGGRVWSVNELERMAEICLRYGIIIVSDEIHADLTLPGFKHHPTASLNPEIAKNVITLMAPSKTFNIPGLSSSFFVANDASLRKKFSDYLDSAELSEGNIFAISAATAAFEKGDEWLDQLTAYLLKNIQYVDNFLKADIPEISICMPQASFLIWLDCRNLHLSDNELHQFFIKKAKLGLNQGISFGPGGEGFMRMNIGCTAATVHKAMEQLKSAVK